MLPIIRESSVRERGSVAGKCTIMWKFGSIPSVRIHPVRAYNAEETMVRNYPASRYRQNWKSTVMRYRFVIDMATMK